MLMAGPRTAMSIGGVGRPARPLRRRGMLPEIHHRHHDPYTRRSTHGSEETDGVRVPKLGQLRDDVLFGDVWEHPDLSKRDRSLITVAMLAALYRTDEMRGHMQRALDNGVTETELKGLITHVAFYAGWPSAVNAGRVAIEVFGPK